ncbi:hypothetical protein QBC37DRAFT_424793 [Rhypophila decipiens]|uniref:Uncharacterized protein n=1 Tax=Rhypophila decipiens TaxID=261697 RepID=A0AAN6YAK2_9PEZI|nr:hypothetical protein QBC37DRAFT_424793 [Rhypophila decipiens]
MNKKRKLRSDGWHRLCWRNEVHVVCHASRRWFAVEPGEAFLTFWQQLFPFYHVSSKRLASSWKLSLHSTGTPCGLLCGVVRATERRDSRSRSRSILCPAICCFHVFPCRGNHLFVCRVIVNSKRKWQSRTPCQHRRQPEPIWACYHRQQAQPQDGWAASDFEHARKQQVSVWSSLSKNGMGGRSWNSLGDVYELCLVFSSGTRR